MEKGKKTGKRLLSWLLAVVMMVSLVPGNGLQVQAAGSDESGDDKTVELMVAQSPKLEVALAVGNTKQDYSNFENELKAALVANNISSDNISFVQVDANASSSQESFPWWRYDHSASSSIYNNSKFPYIENTNSKTQSANDYNSYNYHIVTSTDGKTMDFYGYGSSPYKDFNFLPNEQATKKTIEFTIKEGTAYDAFDGIGFLINTSITGTYQSNQKINGYLLFMYYGSGGRGQKIYLYKLTNVDTYALHHNAAGEISGVSGVSLVATSTTTYGSDYRNRKFKIEVMPTYLKMWYTGVGSIAGNTEGNLPNELTDSHIVTWSGQSNVTECKLEPGYDKVGTTEVYRGGFGPLSSYRSHNCNQLTHVTLSNLSMTAEYVRSLTEVVREPSWSQDKLSFLVNLNEDQIGDFSQDYTSAEIINRLEQENVTYIGWCGTNNVDASQVFVDGISRGSGLVNMNDQTAYGSDYTTAASRSKQIKAIADLIAAKVVKESGSSGVYTYLDTDDFHFTCSGAALTDGKWSVGYAADTFDNAKNSISNYSDLAGASFVLPGYYEIYYGGDTDNPKAKIRIHQAPKAIFTSTIDSDGKIQITNKSYDPDKQSDSSSATGSTQDGIKSTEIEYRKITGATSETTWTQTAPDKVEENEIWMVRLTVTDEDGASDMLVQQVTKQSENSGSGGSGTSVSKAPFNAFTLSKGTYIKSIDDAVEVIDQSYSLDGQDFTVDYVLKGSTLTNDVKLSFQPATTNTYALSNLKAGTYTITMTAKSSGGKESAATSRTFTVKEGFTVEYDANAGGDTVTGLPSIQYKIKDEQLTLSSVLPARSGYIFAGWATEENGEVVYKKGDTYSNNSNIKLYAVWKLPIDYVADDYKNVYDGIGHNITVKVNKPASMETSNGQILYKMQNVDSQTALDNLPDVISENEITSTSLEIKDAGWYKVYYKIQADGYLTIVGSKNVVISKADPVSVTLANKAYTSIPTGYCVIDEAVIKGVDGNNVTDGTVEYKYYLDKNCTTPTTTEHDAVGIGQAPKNKGTYYVKAFFKNHKNYKDAESNVACLCVLPDVYYYNTQGEKTYGTLEDVLAATDNTKKRIYIEGDMLIEESVEIPSGYTLFVEPDVVVTLSQGVTLTNNGTIRNSGTFTGDGKIINNKSFDGGNVAVPFINNGNVTYTDFNDPEKLDKVVPVTNNNTMNDCNGNNIENGENGKVKTDGEVVTYTVTFDAKFNLTADNQAKVENPESQSVKWGDKITTEPTVSNIKDVTEFKGWYKDKACENKWDFAKDTVNSDITLYAKWEEFTTYEAYWVDEKGDKHFGSFDDVLNQIKPSSETGDKSPATELHIQKPVTIPKDTTVSIPENVPVVIETTGGLNCQPGSKFIAPGGIDNKGIIQQDPQTNEEDFVDKKPTISADNNKITNNNEIDGVQLDSPVDNKENANIKNSDIKKDLDNSGNVEDSTAQGPVKNNETGTLKNTDPTDKSTFENNGKYEDEAGVKTFKVTYNVVLPENSQDDVETIPAVTVTYNGLASFKRPNVTTEGSNLVFSGWYKEAECNTLWDFKKDKVTQATTLYTKLQPASEFEASWKDPNDPDGGITYGSLEQAFGSESSEITIQKDVTLPSDTEIKDDVTVTVAEKANATIPKDVAITLNGKLINNGIITNNGTISGAGKLTNNKALNGGKVATEVVNSSTGTISGATLENKVTNEGTIFQCTLTENSDVDNKNTITDSNIQGKVENNGTISKSTLEENSDVTNNKTISGSDIKGNVVNGDNGKIVDQDLNEITYEITFEMNGYGGTVPSQNLKCGKKITKPQVSDKDYALIGWYTNSEFTSASKWDFTKNTVKGNTTLYAYWLENEKCEASWTNANGDTEYGTLENAIEAAKNNDVDGEKGIHIQNDTTLNKPVAVPEGVKLVVDKDKKLTLDGGSSLTVPAGITNNGTIEATTPAEGESEAAKKPVVTGDVTNANGATLSGIDVKGALDNFGTVTDSDATGTVKNKKDASISNSNITGPLTNDGEVEGGTVKGDVTNNQDANITDTKIEANKVTNDGTLKNATITGKDGDESKATVENGTKGKIENSNITGDTTNNGTIKDSNIKGSVENNNAISGGSIEPKDANDKVTNGTGSDGNNATITGTEITGPVDNNGTLTNANLEHADVDSTDGKVENTVTGEDGTTSSTEVQYTVTFVVNKDGVTTPAQQTVGLGKKVAYPEVAATDGVIEGWYTEASYTNKWNFSKNLVKGNMTLYAKWAETSSFEAYWTEADGHTEYGSLADALKSGSKDVIIQKDASFPAGAVIPKDMTVTVPENITVTIPEDVTVTVNGKLSNKGTIENQGIISVGNQAEVTNDGTVNNAGTISGDGKVTSNKEITGGKIETPVTNNGTIEKAELANKVENAKGASILDSTLTGPVNNAGKISGSKLEGQVTNESGATISKSTLEGKVENDGVITGSTIAETSDVTNNNKIVASDIKGNVTNEENGQVIDEGLNELSYTVTFDNNEKGGKVASQEVKCGQKVTKPETNKEALYTLVGWYTKNSDFTEETKWNFNKNTVNADITLYAYWIENAECEASWKNAAGETVYGTFEDAVKAAENKDVKGAIHIQNDITLNQPAALPEGITLVIDKDKKLTLGKDSSLTVPSGITNEGTIEAASAEEETAKKPVITGDVTNEQGALLKGIDIQGALDNSGSLSGSEVTGDVTNKSGATISDSKITGEVTNEKGATVSNSDITGPLKNDGKVEAGSVKGNVTNNKDGEINETSIQADKVTNEGSLTNATITGKDGEDSKAVVTNGENGKIEDSTITGDTTNKGTITDSDLTGNVVNDKDISGGNIKPKDESDSVTNGKDATITETTITGPVDNNGTLTDANLENADVDSTDGTVVKTESSEGGSSKTEEITYEVKFNVADNAETPAVQKVGLGKKVTPPSGVKVLDEALTITGWYTDASCTKKWNFDENLVKTGMTLYAKFEEKASFEAYWTVTDGDKTETIYGSVEEALKSGSSNVTIQKDATLPKDAVIPKDMTVTVLENVTITIPKDETVKVNGKLNNKGNIDNNGTVSIGDNAVVTNDGTVKNDGTISGDGTVINNKSIAGGMIETPVTNNGTIEKSELTNKVINTKTAEISESTVSGLVENAGKITESALSGDVTNDGTISDSELTADSKLTNNKKIENCEVAGSVKNTDNGKITESTLSGEVSNNGSITDSTLSGKVTNDGNITGGKLTETSKVTNNKNISGCEIEGDVVNTETGKIVDDSLEGVQYKVTFNTNGHGITVPDSQSVVCGRAVQVPAVVKDTDYVFLAWYKDKECTKEWNFTTDTVSRDITLYASWRAKDTYEAYWVDENGEKEYGTFEEALASGSKEIHVQKNISVDKSLVVPEGSTVTVDEGITLTLSKDGSLDSGKGNVVNKGAIIGNKDAKTPQITGPVTNEKGAKLSDVDVNGNVENYGTITGSDITGNVKNGSEGTVEGSTVTGDVDNAGMINDTRITGNTDNKGIMKDSEIIGKVTNEEQAELSNIKVNGDVDNAGTVADSNIEGDVENSGTISNTNITAETVTNNGDMTGGRITADNVTNGGNITDANIEAKKTENKENATMSNTNLVSDEVSNNGTFTENTIQAGKVDNHGKVEGGSIAGKGDNPKAAVTNDKNASINGTDITGDVDNDGEILDSSVTGDVENNGKISESSVTGKTENGKDGSITNANLTGPVTNDGAISDSKITAGSGEGENVVINNGTLTNAEVSENTKVDNTNGTYTDADGKEVAVTVTFTVGKYGTENVPKAQTVTLGKKAVKPVNPQDDSYTFRGWYKEESCQTAWDFEKDTVKADTTLYAKWESKSSFEAYWIVTKDGITEEVYGSVEEALKSGSDKVVIRQSVTIPDKTVIPENMKVTVKEGVTVTIPKDADVTVNGTLDNHGTLNNKGIIEDNGNVNNKGTLNNDGKIVGEGTLNNEKNLYGGTVDTDVKNSGKIEDSTLSGEVTNEGIISGSKLTEDSKVTNKKKLENCEVAGSVTNTDTGKIEDSTLSGEVTNNGNISGGELTETSKVTNNKNISGCEIKGDVVNTETGKIVDNSLEGVQYKVTFNTNGHGITVPDSQSVVCGRAVQVPAVVKDTDYVFLAWYKDKECTKEWNFTTDTVSRDITLYASWREKDTYEAYWVDENGEKEYGTFEEALASGSKEIHVQKNTTVDKSLVVPEGSTVTVDEGITLTLSKDGSLDSGKGNVVNKGAIIGNKDAKTPQITGSVTNEKGAKLSDVDVNGNVENYGTITGSDITGNVKNGSEGTVEGSTVTGDVDNAGTINDTRITGKTDNAGTITNSEIAGDTNNKGTIAATQITAETVTNNGDMTGGRITADNVTNGGNITDANIEAKKTENKENATMSNTNLVSDEVSNNGTFTENTIQAGKVDNHGKVEGGSIAGKGDNPKAAVTNDKNASINGTDITGDVDNDGEILDSSVTGDVENNGKISESSVTGKTENGKDGSITNANLTGPVTNDGAISDSKITAGSGEDENVVVNNGTLTNAEVSENTKVDNTNGTYTDAGGKEVAVTVTFTVGKYGTENVPKAQTVTLGKKAVKPVNPQDDSYTFRGWYKEESCQTAWDFEKDTVKADTTLYAKWESKSSFEAYWIVTKDGITEEVYGSVEEALKSGSDEVVIRQSVTIPDKTVIPENMKVTVKEGVTVTIPKDADVTVNGTLDNHGTLNNKGIIKDNGNVNNKGTLNNDGKIVGEGTLNNEKNINGGTISSKVNNTGKISGSNLSGDVKNDGNISDSVLTGKVDNKGTISGSTLDGNVTNDGNISGGRLTENSNVTNNKNISGCDIKGEVVNTENGKIVDDSLKDISYQVTFDINGHGLTVPEKQTIVCGRVVKEPETVMDTDYIFQGWYLDKACKNAWNFEKTVNADITLYASWRAKSSYETYWMNETGEKQYGTFEEALKSGSTEIHVQKDTIVDKALTIPENTKVIVDAGKTLTLNKDGSITFADNAKLVNNGNIEGDSAAAKPQITGNVENSPEAKMKDCYVSGNVTNEGTIDGGSIAGDVTNDGSIAESKITGSLTNNAEASVNNSSISGNVENNGSISGGSLEGDVTNNEGGNIENADIQSDKVVNNGTIHKSTVQAKDEQTAVVTNGENGKIIETDVHTGSVDNKGTIGGNSTVKAEVETINDGTISNATLDGNVTNNGMIESSNIEKAEINNENGVVKDVVKDEEGKEESKVVTHTVSFVSGEFGENPESQIIEYGKKAVCPKDPIDETHAFTGWYVDETCKTPFTFTTAIKKDYTLYGNWMLKEEAQAYWSIDGETKYGTLEEALSSGSNDIHISRDIEFTEPFTIAENVNITVDEGVTVKIAEDVEINLAKSAELINNGTLQNKGSINGDGKVTNNKVITEGSIDTVLENNGTVKNAQLNGFVENNKNISECEINDGLKNNADAKVVVDGDKVVYEDTTLKGIVYKETSDTETTQDIQKHATVQLKKGNTIIAETTTNADGSYVLPEGVPTGMYNMVITSADGNYVNTLLADVGEDDIQVTDVPLPEGNLNNTVVIEKDTPDIVIGGLENLLKTDESVVIGNRDNEGLTSDDVSKLDNGGSVEIQFVANKLDSVPDEEKIIEETATNDKMEIGMNLNLTVLKQITAVEGDTMIAEEPVKLTELKATIMMNIPIPEEMQNQKRYVIYRYHDGTVDKIIEGDAEEHIVVGKDGKNITLYAKKFSTYALAYEKDNSEVEKAVADVSELIEAIGAVDAGAASKEKIEAARKAYEALSEEAKKAVPAEVLKALTDAEEAYTKAVEEEKKAEEEAKKAEEIKKEAEEAAKIIEAIGAVDAGAASKEKIEAARKAYEALSEEAKKAVPAEVLKALTDAEEAYTKAVEEEKKAEEEAKKAEEIKKEAEEAAKIIEAIGAVDAGAASKEKIEAARKAYEALSEEAKKAVPTEVLKALTDAEEAYTKAVEEEKKAEEEAKKAEEEAKKAEEIKKEAEEAAKIIEAIGAVDAGAASKEKIEAARKAYEALSEEAKKAVPAEVLKALTDAEATYKKAVEQTKKSATVTKSVEDTVKLIKAIGTVDAKNASKEKIEAARKAYEALSAEAKKAVPAETLKVLTDAEAAYKNAVAANEIKDESALTGNEIADRDDLPLLLTTGKEASKTSIKLTWLKVEKASAYEVYWSYCDGKKNFKKLATVKATKSRNYTHKKIKKNKSYKYFIVAYKMVDGKKVYQAKSPEIHVAMSYNSKTNAKAIKVNKTKITLAVNKSFKLKSTIVKQNKKKKVLTHAAELRYYSSDLEVATVDKKGKITAKSKGSCTIYVIANNGVSKKVKVTVK